MTLSSASIEKQVKIFCSEIGADPLLVQGAGGNVSWKEGDVLWVKASGTWLAEAKMKEIFVPVNLSLLQDAIAREDYSVSPSVIGDSLLRPSIETLLHALMPHRVVVHLHAVEILAHLVRYEPLDKVKKLVGEAVTWVYVDYHQPGAGLVKAISEQLVNKAHADVVFLGNHGVVIGGESIEEVTSVLHTLISKLRTEVATSSTCGGTRALESEFLSRGYVPCTDKTLDELACNDEISARLRSDWALYPDHVVFLGPKPAILALDSGMNKLDELAMDKPPFIFAIGDGVYESTQVNTAQECQLRCYYDIIVRQRASDKLASLTGSQVSQLLNWDAEKHRQSLTICKVRA